MASYVALQLFRRVYPTVPLYIHYDALESNGQTPQLAIDFDASLVTYNKAISDRSSASHGMYFSTVQAVEEYIGRLRSAASLQPEGWVFLLEDDVWAWRHLERQDLAFDVSGTCWGNYESKQSDLIKKHSRYSVFQNATCYGGCGGHLVNSSRLLGIVDSTSTRDLIAGLLDLDTYIPSDVLLCALILQDGGSIGEYQGFYEYGGILNPVLKTRGDGTIKTLHQMKWFYLFRFVFG